MLYFSLFLLLGLFSLPAPSRGVCLFDPTNETLQNTCDLSSWLPWNCECCGSDVMSTAMQAIRLRGICCQEKDTKRDCLQNCGYNQTADTEFTQCGQACAHVTRGSKCVTHPSTTTTTPTSTLAVITDPTTPVENTTQMTSGVTPSVVWTTVNSTASNTTRVGQVSHSNSTVGTSTISNTLRTSDVTASTLSTTITRDNVTVHSSSRRSSLASITASSNMSTTVWPTQHTPNPMASSTTNCSENATTSGVSNCSDNGMTSSTTNGTVSTSTNDTNANATSMLNGHITVVTASSKTSVGVLVGAIGGGLLAILIVTGLVLFFVRKKIKSTSSRVHSATSRQSQTPASSDDTMATSSPPLSSGYYEA